jgi:hypothetical protein
MGLAARLLVIPCSVLLGLQVASADAGPDHGILVVQDCEQVPKSVDRVDVRPRQVLIEAYLVEITLRKGMEQGVDPSLFDKAGKAWTVLGIVVGDGSASGQAGGGTSAGAPHGGFAEKTHGTKLGWIGNDPKGFIRASEAFGKTKVLSAPRLLVLDRHRGEIRLGDQLCYRTIVAGNKDATPSVNHIDIGTKLRVRPFVSSAGMIRLEIHPEYTTGHLDDRGVPHTETTQVTTNVMVRDGTTVAMCLPPHTETAKGEESPSLTKKQLIVLVTASLRERQGDKSHTTREPTAESAPSELGVDAQATFKLGGWRQTADDVAVAHVPAPGGE